jgi:hypothetical protein
MANGTRGKRKVILQIDGFFASPQPREKKESEKPENRVFPQVFMEIKKSPKNTIFKKIRKFVFPRKIEFSSV